MYPDVYDRVHICTQSYMTGYIHVPGRIRQGTHMYPEVYVRVHISKNMVSFSKNLYVPAFEKLTAAMGVLPPPSSGAVSERS